MADRNAVRLGSRASRKLHGRQLQVVTARRVSIKRVRVTTDLPRQHWQGNWRRRRKTIEAVREKIEGSRVCVYIAGGNTRSPKTRECGRYAFSDSLVRERPQGGSCLRRRGAKGGTVINGTSNTFNEATQLKIVAEAKGGTELAGIEGHYRIFRHPLESEQ
jgi:hypothetical protein